MATATRWPDCPASPGAEQKTDAAKSAEQAIERAGTLDRAKVIEQLKNGSFDTVMGTMTFDGNVNRKFWTVGQWRDGVFHGVASTGMEGEMAPVAKEGWE